MPLASMNFLRERKLSRVVGEMITAPDVLSHPLQMLGKEEGRQVEDGMGLRFRSSSFSRRFRNNDNNKRANSRATMKMTNCGADPLDE